MIIYDGEFERAWNTGKPLPNMGAYTPGGSVIKAYLNCHVAGVSAGDYVRKEYMHLEPDGVCGLLLTSPAITAEISVSTIAKGGSITLRGVAAGTNAVDIVIIGPEGLKKMPDSFFSEDAIADGLFFTSAEVSRMHVYEKSIRLPEETDSGNYLLLISAPGRDGLYLLTMREGGELFDALMDYGWTENDFIGRNQSQLLEIFIDLIFTPGSDYILWVSTFEVEYRTWHVDDDFTDYPNANFSSIQDAVNASSDGDIVIVYNGTYLENVDVNKSITIVSANGAENTIVQAANSNDHVFEVTADYVNISGFTVKGASAYPPYPAGIYIYADQCNISNNNVTNNYCGIRLYYSSNNTLTSNTASNNNIGITSGYSSNYNALMNNIVSNNSYGIILYYSNNNTITSNTALNNNIEGIRLRSSKYNTLTSNTASDNNIGIYLDVYLGESCNNNTLTNNTVSNNNYGIYLTAGAYLYLNNNNTLTSNTVSNNDYGIYLYYSNNNIIYLNNFINNTCNVDSIESHNIWNSTEKITYTYNSNTYANYLGNYWDDYTDIDADNDGIWDHPRPINSDKDYHPLVKPFENYEEKWSFAIITDMHIGRGYPDYGGKGIDEEDKMMEGRDYYLTERLKKAVGWINENKTNYNIKFVIVLGDIGDSGEYSELNKSKNILDELDVPYVPVIGNHEIWAYTDDEENESARYFEDVFWNESCENIKNNIKLIKKLFADSWHKQPTPMVEYDIISGYKILYLQNYNFTYKEMNFVVLDCVSREHFMHCPSFKGVSSDAILYYNTLNWLNESLNKHKEEPVIIISHHPMTNDSTKAFEDYELKEICKIINGSNCEVVNFAGHIHGSGITRGGDWGHLWHNYFIDANREYVHKDDSTGLLLHSITTEALMVGQNSPKEEGVKGIIRMVNVTGKDVNYEPNKANGEFLSLNPFLYLNSAKDMGVGKQINFTFYPFYSWRWKTLRYTVDWNDSTPIESHTISTSIITGEIREHITHTYTKAGNYIINVTITDLDNPSHMEWITRDIIVTEDAKEPHPLIPPESLLATLWNGADVTENPQNSPEWVLLTKATSETKPIGEIFVHFENATKDIDLSNLTADVNLTTRKSVIYMPSWPNEIEESKILYIPSTGKGAVYICKTATSLEEVSFENADAVITVGETKNGMTVAATLYNDTEYYVVFNITGTGGGEFIPIENIFDTGSPANPYPSIMGNHTGTITPNQPITVYKLYTYPCPGTGGHTEYAKIRNATWNATATWKGYVEDWHNITFDKTVVLLANKTYNYTIRTGSYPQIHHKDALPTANGWINCTKFADVNGKIYRDWIPAIRLLS